MPKQKYYYKLTDQNMQTHNGFQWGLNKTYTVDGKGDLCTKHWLHFYHHPLLASLLNPIHADIRNPRLFKAKVAGKFLDDYGLKIGWTEAILVNELSCAEITLTQRVAFAILCAKCVGNLDAWNTWADNWLENNNRARVAVWAAEAADAARVAVWAAEAADTAAWTVDAARAAAWAADAARAAAWAVEAAESTARAAAPAAWTARAAARAAAPAATQAVQAAAQAAAWAAQAAVEANIRHFSLNNLAKQALKIT